jgi:KDEL-tailed cysteine endopeptidase
MKILSFIAFYLMPAFGILHLRSEADVIDYNLTPNLIDKFDLWVRKFNIEFKNNEFYKMYEKWIHNEEYIEKINAMNLSYSLAHNQFSGMDEFEFKQYIVKNNDLEYGVRDYSYSSYLFNTTLESLPSSVNWVTAGAVTNVKDQGQCGSCWSFSTTGALEGEYFIKNGKLVSFSEQQLVDCDNLKNGGKDHGCNGGLMDNAFSWIHKNGGLCQEADYPYTSGNGQEGTCKKTCSLVKGSQIVSFVDVPPSSDNEMMSALVKQPVSIAIQADTRDFQLYKSGVFTSSTCGTNLDHGVLAVGYGTETGQNYYLVKNSWGTSWGENGYIKLGRGSQYNSGDGQCGMLLEGSYPLL